MSDWSEWIGKRRVFVARYAGNNGAQMLLTDIACEDGEYFRDHLYLPYTARFRKLGLMEGEWLKLKGKVNRYYKRGKGQEGVPAPLVVREAMWGITNVCEVERC